MASITYKQLTAIHIHDAAILHERFIPSAGAKMGKPYLIRLYKTLTTNRAHRVVGAFNHTQLVGLISVTEKIPRLSIAPLIPTMCIGVIRNQLSLNELMNHAIIETRIKRLIGANTRYIMNLAVEPQHQRRGIATKLIRQVNKNNTLIVDTQKKNIGAIKFYKTIGFVPIEEVADSIILRYR